MPAGGVCCRSQEQQSCLRAAVFCCQDQQRACQHLSVWLCFGTPAQRRVGPVAGLLQDAFNTADAAVCVTKQAAFVLM